MFFVKTENVRSSRKIIVRTFAKLFAMIFLVLVVVTTSTVAYRLILNRQHDVVGLAQKMATSDIDSAIDWDTWRQNSIVDLRDVYITAKLNANKQTLYSDRTAKMVATKDVKIKLLDQYYWVHERGLYYRYTVSVKNGRLVVMIGMSSVFKTLKTMLLVMLLTTFALYMLAVFFIRHLADKISAPLVNFTQAVGQVTLNESIEAQLPEVNEPAEVNALRETSVLWLMSLQDQVIREKEFIANASHELKTPLTAFRGNLALIKRRGQDHPEVVPRALELLDQEAERMQGLVSQLLLISQAERQSLKLEPAQPLAEIFDQFLQLAKAETNRQIEIQRIPAGKVITDKTNAVHILKIIFENALKYSESQERVILRLGLDYIEVVDFGLGIPLEDRSKVFERFFRGDRAHSSKINGTGLGLALAAELAVKSQIKISFSDNQPRGTIVRINFLNGK